MNPARENILDTSRFAKAGFYGACKVILALHDNGQVSDERAFLMIKAAFDESLKYTQPAERLLQRLASEMTTNNRGLPDDLPSV